jgi:hypothetical protein
MAVSLKNLKKKLGEVKLFEDDPENTLTVQYYLVVDETLEDQFQQELAALKDGNDPKKRRASVEYQAGRAQKLIASWDLTGDDGKPVPLDGPTILREVPFNLMSMIFEAIGEDRRIKNLSGRKEEE